MRRKVEHAEVLARLERFANLERKATDEAGWIALAYSVTRAKAQRMIDAARAVLARVEGGSDA